MARFRGMRATINSVKHYVPNTNTEIASGAVRNVVVADAVASGEPRVNTFDIEEGAVVKAIYIEQWLNGQGTAGTGTGQFVLVISKQPSGVADPTITNMTALQDWDNKKNIFYTTQGVIGGVGNQSLPLYRDWVLIPKGKQRMGRGDTITVTIGMVGVAADNCGIATYKEYF